MAKIDVFIAGADHSGTTMRDKILGSHSELTGLGEVDTLIRTYLARPDAIMEKTCSCGKHVMSCRFWDPFWNGSLLPER